MKRLLHGLHARRNTGPQLLPQVLQAHHHYTQGTPAIQGVSSIKHSGKSASPVCVYIYIIYIYAYIYIIHISLGCVPTQELGWTSKQSQKSQHPLPSHVKEPTPAPCGEPSAWLFELGRPCPTKGCAESSRSFAHRPGAEELILWSLGRFLFG